MVTTIFVKRLICGSDLLAAFFGQPLLRRTGYEPVRVPLSHQTSIVGTQDFPLRVCGHSENGVAVTKVLHGGNPCARTVEVA